MEKEENFLQELLEMEDLAGKKAKIYSRLLMDADKAQKMEALSLRHESRREKIEALLYGKALSAKKKKGGE